MVLMEIHASIPLEININVGEKKNPLSILEGGYLLSGSTPEVNGIYTGLRLTLHPSFIDINTAVFV